MLMKYHLLIGLTAITFILHAIEEYFMDFHNSDELLLLFTKIFGIQNYNLAIWMMIQIVMIIFLFYLWFNYSKSGVYILLAILLFELSHPIESLLQIKYTPGLFTALIFPFLGYQWIKIRKRMNR